MTSPANALFTCSFTTDSILATPFVVCLVEPCFCSFFDGEDFDFEALLLPLLNKLMPSDSVHLQMCG